LGFRVWGFAYPVLLASAKPSKQKASAPALLLRKAAGLPILHPCLQVQTSSSEHRQPPRVLPYPARHNVSGSGFRVQGRSRV
jgi:hypothetical protein